MPILTISVIALPVLPSHCPARILSLAALTDCSCCFTSAMRSLAWLLLASSGSARRAACNTARFSVLLMGSPANMAARWLSSGDCSANFNSSDQTLSLTKFLEKSKNNSPLLTENFSARWESAANKSVIRTSVALSASALRLDQAVVVVGE